VAKEYFHLVEAVRLADKWFDVSIQEIVRQFHAVGKLEVHGDVDVIDPNSGSVETVPVRLKASGNAEYSISWDLALLLHNVRIDGFGWEGMPFPDILKGGECKGWHRHIWNPATGNADGKTCVDIYEVPLLSVEDFAIWGLRAMNVGFNRKDESARLF